MKAQLSLIGFVCVIALMLATLYHWPSAPSAPASGMTRAAKAEKILPPGAKQAPGNAAFASRLQEIYASLPTNEQVAASLRNSEASPQEIFEASDKLGEIREILQKDPSAAAQAANFFDQCARKQGVLVSIRSMCLRNLLDLQAQRKEADSVHEHQYDREVLALAKSIPSIPFDLAR